MANWYDKWLGVNNSGLAGSATVDDFNAPMDQDFSATASGQSIGMNVPVATTDNAGAMDWLNQNSKGIGTAMGLAGLGMDAYSTFFGQGKDYYDKNMTLLNQQIADNQSKLDRQAAVSQAWSDTEKAKNSGLAATGK